MSVPDSIRQLAQERLDARAARDFAKADALRQEILQAEIGRAHV
jgi:cysteinyl-tRNA synthetase